MCPTDKLRAFVADHPCEPFTQEDAVWLLEHIESLEKAILGGAISFAVTACAMHRIVTGEWW